VLCREERPNCLARRGIFSTSSSRICMSDTPRMQIVRDPAQFDVMGHRKYLVPSCPIARRGRPGRSACGSRRPIGAGRNSALLNSLYEQVQGSGTRHLRGKGIANPSAPSSRRQDRAYAQPSNSADLLERSRGQCLVFLLANRRHCRGGSQATFNAKWACGAERAGEGPGKEKQVKGARLMAHFTRLSSSDISRPARLDRLHR